MCTKKHKVSFIKSNLMIVIKTKASLIKGSQSLSKHTNISKPKDILCYLNKKLKAKNRREKKKTINGGEHYADLV